MKAIEDNETLVRLLVGRTIVAAVREPSDPDERWPQGENDVTLTLDDGTIVAFSSYGYDAWGVITEYEKAS